MQPRAMKGGTVPTSAAVVVVMSAPAAAAAEMRCVTHCPQKLLAVATLATKQQTKIYHFVSDTAEPTHASTLGRACESDNSLDEV